MLHNDWLNHLTWKNTQLCNITTQTNTDRSVSTHYSSQVLLSFRSCLIKQESDLDYKPGSRNNVVENTEYGKVKPNFSFV